MYNIKLESTLLAAKYYNGTSPRPETDVVKLGDSDGVPVLDNWVATFKHNPKSHAGRERTTSHSKWKKQELEKMYNSAQASQKKKHARDPCLIIRLHT